VIFHKFQDFFLSAFIALALGIVALAAKVSVNELAGAEKFVRFGLWILLGFNLYCVKSCIRLDSPCRQYSRSKAELVVATSFVILVTACIMFIYHLTLS